MADNQQPSEAEIILNELEKMDALIRHIRHVQDAAIIIGKKLIKSGEAEFGRCLIANAFVHDQSKFRGIEWDNIAARGCIEGDEQLKLAIANHNRSNPHHPEYWGGISLMPEIYLAEMVCDCYARSVEFGSDIRVWFKEDAIKRYDIPKSGKVWKSLKRYLDMLLDEPF